MWKKIEVQIACSDSHIVSQYEQYTYPTIENQQCEKINYDKDSFSRDRAEPYAVSFILFQNIRKIRSRFNWWRDWM